MDETHSDPSLEKHEALVQKQARTIDIENKIKSLAWKLVVFALIVSASMNVVFGTLFVTRHQTQAKLACIAEIEGKPWVGVGTLFDPAKRTDPKVLQDAINQIIEAGHKLHDIDASCPT